MRLEVRRVPDLREFEGIAPAEFLDAEAALRARVAERAGRYEQSGS